MKTVGTYQAKTHLAKLLDRVAKGETITITRHGTPIATLQPVGGAGGPDPKEVVQRLREFRKRHRLRGFSIREMIEEGRR